MIFIDVLLQYDYIILYSTILTHTVWPYCYVMHGVVRLANVLISHDNPYVESLQTCLPQLFAGVVHFAASFKVPQLDIH